MCTCTYLVSHTFGSSFPIFSPYTFSLRSLFKCFLSVSLCLLFLNKISRRDPKDTQKPRYIQQEEIMLNVQPLGNSFFIILFFLFSLRKDFIPSIFFRQGKFMTKAGFFKMCTTFEGYHIKLILLMSFSVFFFFSHYAWSVFLYCTSIASVGVGTS